MIITVALSKGRLLKDFLAFLQSRQLTDYYEALAIEDRSLFIQVGQIRFIFAKGKDVPTYVEEGIADLGIVGLDILKEKPAKVLNLSALAIGQCRLALAGPADLDPQAIQRVATSFPNLTADYFAQKRQEVDVIYLRGSVELAPILGLADAIVDIVQSGQTLVENHLIEYEEILPIEGRLIANCATYYTKEDLMYPFIQELGVFE